jgi:small subunit ribosomal protein S4e
MGSQGEKHMSRLAAPTHWHVKRHGLKWVTKPRPGAHSIKTGMPLNVLIRDVLGYAKTNKEVKTILNSQEVLVDGRRRKELGFAVGFMDVLAFPKAKEYFRILFNKKGKLVLVPVKADESSIKLCKITGKKLVKGKLQINLYDGKNILAEKGDYGVGDSLVIEIPNLKVKETLPLKKGGFIFMMAGKHVGEVGQIKEIKGDKIVVKTEKAEFETLRKYGFVIGKDKPAVSIAESKK